MFGSARERLQVPRNCATSRALWSVNCPRGAPGGSAPLRIARNWLWRKVNMAETIIYSLKKKSFNVQCETIFYWAVLQLVFLLNSDWLGARIQYFLLISPLSFIIGWGCCIAAYLQQLCNKKNSSFRLEQYIPEAHR